MVTGNGNPFELAGSSNYRDSNYRTNFQAKKVWIAEGEKNLFELTERSNYRAFELSEFDCIL